jgi:hypothetical protein
MKMTGKKIVDAFCHYQGYGEWTLKEKELIQAIDDNNKQYEEEIADLNMQLSNAVNHASDYQSRAREAEKELRQINKLYEEGMI